MTNKNLEAKLLNACKALGLACTEYVDAGRAKDWGVPRTTTVKGLYQSNALLIERAATEKAFYRLVYLKAGSSAHFALPGMNSMDSYTLSELRAFLDGIDIAARAIKLRVEQ